MPVTEAVAAASAAVFLLMCVATTRKVSAKEAEDDMAHGGGNTAEIVPARRRRIEDARWPFVAPKSWGGTFVAATRTFGYALSETLGKWPFVDLMIGVRYLMRRGNLQVARVYGEGASAQFQGPEVTEAAAYHLKLLKVCFLFTKRKFPVFLEASGYLQEDVFLQKPKGGFLKPAFALLREKDTNCILLVIRGATSFKDRLTAAASKVVPFHYSVNQEGRIRKLVIGYAHCGMLAAARWIAKCSVPHLLKIVAQYPDYEIQIIGHSMGGGTAAILTCILQEHEEFSGRISCVAFGPATCMTWDLAESTKNFVYTLVNNSDSVPTLSTASVDDFRREVVASSWSKEFRDQIPFTRFMNNLCRWLLTSTPFLPLKFTSDSRSRSTNIAVLHSVNMPQGATQTMVRRNQPSLSCWSCTSAKSPQHGGAAALSGQIAQPGSSYLPIIERVSTGSSSSEHEKGFPPDSVLQAMEEVENGIETVEKKPLGVPTDPTERKQLFPPGRIMHMMGVPPQTESGDEYIAIFETSRSLYSKVRLSRTMINDHYMPMYIKTMEKLLHGRTGSRT